MKVNQSQIVEATMVVARRMRAEWANDVQAERKKLDDAAIAEGKSDPYAQDIIAACKKHSKKIEFSLDSYWDNGYQHPAMRMSFGAHDCVYIPLPKRREQKPAPTFAGIPMNTHDFETEVRKVLRNQIKEAQMQALLADKEFKLGLQDFLTRLGVTVNVKKLLAEPAA